MSLRSFSSSHKLLCQKPYPKEGDGGEESYEQDFREPPLAKGKSAGDKAGGAPQRLDKGYQAAAWSRRQEAHQVRSQHRKAP